MTKFLVVVSTSNHHWPHLHFLLLGCLSMLSLWSNKHINIHRNLGKCWVILLPSSLTQKVENHESYLVHGLTIYKLRPSQRITLK
jgi:uncharacterized membrane protein